MKNTRDRLQQLKATVARANAQLDALEDEKAAVEAELERLQGEIDAQRQKLSDENEALGEITENVDALRDACRKTQRGLDKALKEIAGWNDEIEKSASDRHAIYRRCRLEEIELPLAKGNLERVPIEEQFAGGTEDEGADEDEDVDMEGGGAGAGGVKARKVKDWGVEPDFESLDEEDREVS